jgi:hypothetical protein
MVLTGPFDVVGRIIVAVRPSDGILDEAEEVIESNCRSLKGSNIKGGHSHILLSSNMVTSATDTVSGAQLAGP